MTMSHNTESQLGAHVALEQLKEHYKHCIKLSTANKINPKNAFDLQLIDYMQDIAISNPDGQMNFKIASSALDVGAKIYSNRVDCIQGVAQKVASSLMMAVDGQKGHQNDNEDDPNESNADVNTSGVSNIDDGGEEGTARSRHKKNRTKRRQVKYLSDDATLSADIESVVLSEPVSADVQDNDMTSAAALIVHNQIVEETGRPVFDLEYKETSSSKEISNIPSVTLTWKNVASAVIIDKAEETICPRFAGFLFVDKTSKMQGYDTNLDESIDTSGPLNSSGFAAPMEEEVDKCDFDAHNYDDGVANDDIMDCGEIVDDCQADLNRTLETIAEVKRSEYDHRLLNTWAGPHAWTTVRVPQTTKKDGAPKSVRKRVKLEHMPINVDEERPVVSDEISEKGIRHSSAVIRKWKKLLKPQDYNLTDEIVRKGLQTGFLRPEDTYQCVKTSQEALRQVNNDHDYADRASSADEALQSSINFGGFDDVHDDSDDEFRADPVVNGNENVNFATNLNTSFTQPGDLEFAGENLIEQPHTVAQVVIPYSRAAKKIDVRKLKHVMWSVLLPPEVREVQAQNQDSTHDTTTQDGQLAVVGGDPSTTSEATKKTPSPSPSESAFHLAFSNLYGELPVRVSHRMANDLSQPIAFVTLLHLANEKNLKLIPKQDLKDFIIEQDEILV